MKNPHCRNCCKSNRYLKQNVSADEAKQLPKLQQTKNLNPQPGNLILSTFFIASNEASNLKDSPPFDYVIVDEASQALLAMFAAAKLLGKRNIWIGDTKQLPPVVAINEDKVNKKNYGFLVDGLKALSDTASIPIYQLTETYRLPIRGAEYTGLFYENSLKSKAKTDIQLSFAEMPSDIGMFFNPKGGSTLIKTDLNVGSKTPKQALEIAKFLVAHLIKVEESIHISVLSNYIDTVKALQKTIYSSVGNHNNLLIETVARIQGLTTDVTIFIIPNTGYNHSLDKRLFNVATSRAKRHTIIISDKNVITDYPRLNGDVKNYLQKLDNEYSFYYSPQKKIAEPGPVTLEEPLKKKPRVKIIGKIDPATFERPKKELKKDKENLYVIDTNVFVDCPDIITKIDKQYPIILSAKVLDELDSLKSTINTEGKSNVQKALKSLNQNINKRDLRMEVSDLSLLPIDFNKRSADNLILTVALKFNSENPIFINLR